jgi:hypothetical protein
MASSLALESSALPWESRSTIATGGGPSKVAMGASSDTQEYVD